MQVEWGVLWPAIRAAVKAEWKKSDESKRGDGPDEVNHTSSMDVVITAPMVTPLVASGTVRITA